MRQQGFICCCSEMDCLYSEELFLRSRTTVFVLTNTQVSLCLDRNETRTHTHQLTLIMVSIPRVNPHLSQGLQAV